MTKTNHRIVRGFIAAMSDGDISDDIVTPDFSVWVVFGGTVGKEAYQKGIQMLSQIMAGKIAFTIHSLTAEDDRVVAEFCGDGTLKNGKVYHNDYLYLFKIRDGRVASLAEYLNVDAMRDTLIPAMAALQK